MKKKTETKDWVRGLKVGDEVVRRYKDRPEHDEILMVDAIFPHGFQNRRQDVTGRYVVEVSGELYDTRGTSLDDDELLIEPVTQDMRDKQTREDLVEHFKNMDDDQWDDLDLEVLKAAYKLIAGRDWIE